MAGETMIEAAARRHGSWVAEPARLVPLAGAALATVAVLVGQSLEASGHKLGAFFPPFYAHWNPSAGQIAPLAIVILAGAAMLAPTLFGRVRSSALLACCLYVMALALGVALNVSRAGGAHNLWAVFQPGPGGSVEAYQEYLPGLWALHRGVPSYVSHFPSLIPSLPIHVKGNPPGPLVALHLIGIGSAEGLAALCIGVGALTAPLAYDLGRTLDGEQRGRVAGILTAFSPALLLWGVTSADYAFATLGLAAACLMVRRGAAPRWTGAFVGAAGCFFSWLLFAIPAWAVLVAWRRDGPRRALVSACTSALAIVMVFGALALTLGYDPLATLKATDAAYRHGIARVRPYDYWIVGSPAAWWIALGLPIGWGMLRAGARGDPAALALVAIVIAGSVLGLTKAETERIWLPFVPLACAAAAAALPPRHLRPVLYALIAQALAIQLLFDTVW